ncbi:HAD family hydrolase [Salinispira pacifica]
MQVVLFDFDGTLADTVPLVIAVTNLVLESSGRSEVDAEEVRRGMVHATPLRMGLHARVSDPAIQSKLAAEYYRRALERAGDSVTLFPGMKELVRELHARDVPLGIVSNNSTRFINAALAGLEMDRLFSAVLGDEDLPAPKPAPDGLLKAARILGAEPAECVYLGDAPGDLTAARAAGMPAIGVAWGTYDAVELLSAGFESVFEESDELRKTLIGSLTSGSPDRRSR